MPKASLGLAALSEWQAAVGGLNAAHSSWSGVVESRELSETRNCSDISVNDLIIFQLLEGR